MEPKTTYIALKPDKNGVIPYSAENHETWNLLYTRQSKFVENRACDEFIEGVARLGLKPDRIPQCSEVSDALKKHTGWCVKPVEALISFKTFFEMLANRTFPAASFIRRKDELDYLKEPDIFHELFGHCTLLTNQAFAGFTHEVGKLGVMMNKEDRETLARLYWFTVEFGLIQTKQGLRIFGGGILSSKQETIYALESDIPTRQPFDLVTVLRTPYRYDELQKTYFVIESFDRLYALLKTDLRGAFAKAKELGTFESVRKPEVWNDVRSC